MTIGEAGANLIMRYPVESAVFLGCVVLAQSAFIAYRTARIVRGR